jgi:hypothetical protein
MKKTLLTLLALSVISTLSMTTLRAEGDCDGCKGKKEETKKEEPKKS